jgi:hypothetical protein
MVETITPVVYGGRRRWIGALALHIAGAALTAVVFGALLGMTGALLGLGDGRAEVVAVALLGAVYLVGYVGQDLLPVPQLRRQVPDWWRTFFSPGVTAFLYGAGLGVGFLTYLTSGALVVVSAGAIASGSPWIGAIILLPFGLARGVSAIVAANVTTSDEGRSLVDRLAARADGVRRAVGAASLAAVAGLATIAARDLSGGWAELAGAIVAGAFAWAGVAKLAGARRWRRVVADHALPPTVERSAIRVVPAAELAVPALALLGYGRASAIWAIALLAVFSAEVMRMRLRSPSAVPCGCFGGRHALPAGTLLIRNALLVLLAAGTATAISDPSVSLPGAPAGGEILPFALAVGGLLAGVLAAWRASVWLSRGRA